MLKSSYVNRTYILDMLQRMRELCEKNETCRLDFENAGSLSETYYCSLVGLSKQFFDELSKEVEPYLKNTPLCIEYDRRWKTKLLLFSMKI
jgi:hypothetical protein